MEHDEPMRPLGSFEIREMMKNVDNMKPLEGKSKIYHVDDLKKNPDTLKKVECIACENTFLVLISDLEEKKDIYCRYCYHVMHAKK
jgi:DNA-directed RNA polymerase subunit RPC12/RpoP